MQLRTLKLISSNIIIIHLNDRLVVGGVSVIIKILSEAIKNKGWINKIFIANSRNAIYKQNGLIADDWVFSGFGKIKIVMECFFPLKLMREIKNNKKNGQVIIHLHTPFLPVSISALVSSKVCRVPLIYTVHANNSHIPIIYRIYERLLMLVVDEIVFELKSSLKDYSIISTFKKNKWIPFGVDKSSANIRWAPNTGESFIFILANRLDPNRMTKKLVEAFINQKEITDRLIVIGDGPEKNAIQKYVNDSGISGDVEFISTVEEKKLQTYFEKSSCFLTLSASGDVGMAAKIAANMGMPLLSYEFDLRETSDLYAATTVDDLSTKMRQLKKLDHLLLKEYGENIKKQLGANAGDMIESYMHIYQNTNE